MSRFWDHHQLTIDPSRFRAHDQYMAQPDDYPYGKIVEALTVIGHDQRIHQLGEDGSYGVRTWVYRDMVVSRDLLDSLLEIAFLERYLPRFGIQRVLDIGCGYGRLARRLLQLHSHMHVTCSDPVDVSRQVCRLYRSHSGFSKPAWDVSLPENVMFPRYDLAINVHSWSECTPDEVYWWVSRLSNATVPYLFVLPHDPDCSTKDAYDSGVGVGQRDGNGGGEFISLIYDAGYVECAQWSPLECDARFYRLFRHRSA